VVIAVIFSVAVFFMWLKLLYFLRIFEDTGYLIRMIIEVVADMRFFLLILFVAQIAFGNAMLMIALTNPDGEKQFVTSWTDSWIFSYLIGLGDWDTGNFDGNASTAVWIFFLLNTVFSTVVMLNLLIAIISDTYARVKENAESAAYQEKARMISENAYLIPEAKKDA